MFLLFWFLWEFYFWSKRKKKGKYAMKASFKICDGQPFHVTQGVDHHIRYVIFLLDICGKQHDVITLMLKKDLGCGGSLNVIAFAMVIELNLSSKGEMW